MLPRTIDVRQFAAAREKEVSSLAVSIILCDILSLFSVFTQLQGLCESLRNEGILGAENYPRCLRRRTRSHNPYVHRHRPNAALAEKRKQGDDKSLQNRAMRRKKRCLRSEIQQSCSWTEANIQSSSMRRLETHIWHAKRLLMGTHWNWKLPQGLSKPGKGDRYFLRKLNTGSFMHDASYLCPMIIENLETKPSSLRELLDGGTLAPHTGRDGQIVRSCYSMTHLDLNDSCIIWSHPAAVQEVYSALQQLDSTLRVGSHLRRLDLFGGKLADGTLLADTLFPNELSKITQLRPGDVLELTLVDPRLTKCVDGQTILDATETRGATPGDILACAEGVPPPVPYEEKDISAIRQRYRNININTGLTPSASSSEALQQERCCAPAILACHRHNHWSLVVPMGWVQPIWVALAHRAFVPAGQQEWQWYHTLHNLTYCPIDLHPQGIIDSGIVDHVSVVVPGKGRLTPGSSIASPTSPSSSSDSSIGIVTSVAPGGKSGIGWVRFQNEGKKEEEEEEESTLAYAMVATSDERPSFRILVTKINESYLFNT